MDETNPEEILDQQCESLPSVQIPETSVAETSVASIVPHSQFNNVPDMYKNDAIAYQEILDLVRKHKEKVSVVMLPTLYALENNLSIGKYKLQSTIYRHMLSQGPSTSGLQSSSALHSQANDESSPGNVVQGTSKH